MIEIMIVVSILTLLVILMVSNFLDYTAKAREQGARAYLTSYYSSTKNATMYLGCNPGNFVAVGFNPTGVVRSRILTEDGNCDDLPVGFVTQSQDCVSTAYDKKHSGSECVKKSYKPLFEENASLENLGDKECPAIDGQSISPVNEGKNYFFKALACSDYDDPLLMCVCHNGAIGVGKEQCSSDECKNCTTENCSSYGCRTDADCNADPSKPECNLATRVCWSGEQSGCTPPCDTGETCNESTGNCESTCTLSCTSPQWCATVNGEDTCVDCIANTDCEDGEVCSNNKCEPAPQCTQHDLDNCIYCTGGISKQQCPSPENPQSQYCAGKHSDGNRSQCHACLSDAECEKCGEKCNTQTNPNRCVQTLCTDQRKPFCTTRGGQDECVECLNHGHCEKLYSDKTICDPLGKCIGRD